MLPCSPPFWLRASSHDEGQSRRFMLWLRFRFPRCSLLITSLCWLNRPRTRLQLMDRIYGGISKRSWKLLLGNKGRQFFFSFKFWPLRWWDVSLQTDVKAWERATSVFFPTASEVEVIWVSPLQTSTLLSPLSGKVIIIALWRLRVSYCKHSWFPSRPFLVLRCLSKKRCQSHLHPIW